MYLIYHSGPPPGYINRTYLYPQTYAQKCAARADYFLSYLAYYKGKRRKGAWQNDTLELWRKYFTAIQTPPNRLLFDYCAGGAAGLRRAVLPGYLSPGPGTGPTTDGATGVRPNRPGSTAARWQELLNVDQKRPGQRP